MDPEKVLEDIKNLKIQGAQNVSIKGVGAVYSFFLDHSLYETFDFIIRIVRCRITEPSLRNAILGLFKGTHFDNLIKKFYSNLDSFSIDRKMFNFEMDEKRVVLNYQYIIDHYHKVNERISKNVLDYLKSIFPKNKKIRIYTHCHSSTVTKAIKYIHESEDFDVKVFNTETRPLFQGRITASELLSYGIEVEHYVDSGMLYCIKQADVIFLGSDAIEYDGSVLNKIGSGAISYLALQFGKPVFILSDSWKIDKFTKEKKEDIEIRSSKEIFDDDFSEHFVKHKIYISGEIKDIFVVQNSSSDVGKTNFTVKNYAFERIPASNITAIFTDLGTIKTDEVMNF